MAIEVRNNKKGTTYLVRVRDGLGRWYPVQAFDRKLDAERHERALMSKKEQGTTAFIDSQSQMTFQAYWTRWSEERRQSVSEGWKYSQNQMARDYLLPVLGQMPLKAIHRTDIQLVLKGMVKAGLGQQTQVHAYNILSKMFRDGVNVYEWLIKSPVNPEDKPRIRKKERAFLTPNESRVLLEASKGHFLGPAIWIGLLTALRPSEVQALKWNAVDFEKKQINIQAAYKRKVRMIEPYPKQGDWGKVPMPEALVVYLKTLKASSRCSIFVAPGMNGGMLKYEVLLIGLRRLCKAAGLKQITPHELRHSATEIYVDRGASPEDVRRLLNHASFSSSTQRYLHGTEGRLAGIASMIEIGRGSNSAQDYGNQCSLSVHFPCENAAIGACRDIKSVVSS